MYYSGFVEAENVKDYAQNRSAYVNVGKGEFFEIAVADVDARIDGTQMKNAVPQKTDAIFVKVENESNGIKVLKYDCPSTSTASNVTPTGNNDRLMAELADVRQKYCNAVYDLEKTKEITVALKKTIDVNNGTIDSLTAQNAELESRIVATESQMNILQRENDTLKSEKKQFESSMKSLRKEQMAAISNEEHKTKDIERLQKEVKILQARLKQNVSGAEQNKRYFSQTAAQTIDNNYEVKELLDHRKRNTQREFLVRWKDTWEKESSLNCPKILKAYLKRH